MASSLARTPNAALVLADGSVFRSLGVGAEGRVEGKPVFSVQFHSEASPGPRDSHYLFRAFVKRMGIAVRPSTE